MSGDVHVLAYDVGTSGVKTCLFLIGRRVELLAAATAEYGLWVADDGAAEQDPAEIWDALGASTRQVMAASGVPADAIAGLSFCAQMQSLILVDVDGAPVRRSMSYLDQRATRELREGIGHGVRVAGMNARKLATALRITGAAPASVKDPVWKYNWVRRNEPDAFARAATWLDVKEYLILRCTGERVMTPDSAFGTLLYDPAAGRFSTRLCRMFGVDAAHLPRIVASTDVVGPLTDAAAAQLGLVSGIPVFGGGGDASLIGVGAGAAGVGSTHVYCGTSGWVSTVVTERKVDVTSMIASIVGVTPGRYNYFAELETAGKCLEWVRDHLALDEIGVYLHEALGDQAPTASPEAIRTHLYDFMLAEIRGVPAGSGGVVFTPWLHGNRCPFEDPHAAGMFFNIKLETGKRELIHAVLEGICHHLRWQLEAQRAKVRPSRIVRFVGGGALAPLTCQLLADILGSEVQTVRHPQNVGALGAAVVVAVGLGVLASVDEADRLITPSEIYYPDPSVKDVHDRNHRVFIDLYRRNRRSFRALNAA